MHELPRAVNQSQERARCIEERQQAKFTVYQGVLSEIYY